MSVGTPEAATLNDDDVVAIAKDVWASFLGIELDRATRRPAGGTGAPVTGEVRVFEAWEGAVVLECSGAMARTVAARMFDKDVDDVDDAEVVDALGELTNMIGGNIKSLLPAPSRLSLPAVIHGSWQRPDAGVLVTEVGLAALPGGEPLSIRVWQS